jgi:AraC-like DNA-binding protein
MILAKSLIKKNISFNQIYTMCGFNDYTSFFRAFKKEYNITPKEFQKAHILITKE